MNYDLTNKENKLVFLEEPAIELLARLDGKEKIIHIGKRISELNDMLVDGEMVLLRLYKIDYRKTIL